MRNKSRIVSSRPPLHATHHPGHVGHWRLTDGSGDPQDVSGNGLHLTAGSSLATHWSDNVGALTLPGEDTDGSTAKSGISAYNNTQQTMPDWSSQSMLVSYWWKEAASDTTTFQTVLGSGGTANQHGWRVFTTVNGQHRFVLHNGTELSSGNSSSDGDDNAWHHWCWIVDGPNELLSLYFDGAVDATFNGYDFSGLQLQQTIATGCGFALGSTLDASGSRTAAGGYKDVRVVTFDGDTPANINAIISKLYRRKYVPLTLADFA